jgi:hypothetical protein
MSRGHYVTERKRPRSQTDADDVDVLCSTWARAQRELLGLDKRELRPEERLGRLRSTLGRVREDKVAAGYFTKLSQQFPEVYSGMVLLVHRAFCLMPAGAKEAVYMNYVWFDISAPVKAEQIGASLKQYWILVGEGKSFIRGAIVMGSEPGTMVHGSESVIS